MKPYRRIDEILDPALKRLGTPPPEGLEAARERIRKNLSSINPADMPPLSLSDTKPVSLWGLRQPFLIAGGVFIAIAALTATTFWIHSWRNPSVSVSTTVDRAGSAPPIIQADSGGPLHPTESYEVHATPSPSIDLPVPRGKATKRPAPKRAVEEVKLPEPRPTVTDGRPTAPGTVPLPESILVQSDGDPGKAVLDRVCTVCHSLRGIEKHNYSSPDAYKELVSEMISRGAVVTDEDIATIVEYLYKTYGQK